MATYLRDDDGEIVAVPEETTLAIAYSLTDEAGAAATLTALSWSLTEKDGTIINERSGVDVDPPEATGTIVLTGDDLALTSQVQPYEWRLLTLTGTYNSDLGSGLVLTEELWFRVRNLVLTT